MARVHGSWLAFGLLLGMSSVWANPVLVAAEDDWAPYCALDKESGQPQGLAPALVKAVFAIEGIALEFRTIPFARCMHEAKSDKVLACFNATITEENRYQYTGTRPPVRGGSRLFALQAAGTMTSNSPPWGARSGHYPGLHISTDFMDNPRITAFRQIGCQIIEMLYAEGRLHTDERDA